jgi:hypothetical protein
MHRLWIVLLSLGAVVGLGSAAHGSFRQHHDEFERHIADVCADAALRSAAKTLPKN